MKGTKISKSVGAASACGNAQAEACGYDCTEAARNMQPVTCNTQAIIGNRQLLTLYPVFFNHEAHEEKDWHEEHEEKH
jgi:hypothetical protein